MEVVVRPVPVPAAPVPAVPTAAPEPAADKQAPPVPVGRRVSAETAAERPAVGDRLEVESGEARPVLPVAQAAPDPTTRVASRARAGPSMRVPTQTCATRAWTPGARRVTQRRL